ncbi:MAG TPA: zinc-dependent metalloprotease family protein [Chloroflexia bacterium]|nr:zinc-dependent metalloprotease family protein [Chloroflexia bacterium]
MYQRFRLILAALLLLVIGGILSGANSGVSLASAPTGALWHDVSAANIAPAGTRQIIPSKYRTVAVDEAALATILAQAPAESATNSPKTSGAVITLPLPDGSYGRFSFVNSPIMAASLAARYPQIQTFMGQGIDDATASVRFDRTQFGFHAMILAAGGTVFIDPYQQNDTTNYISYFKSDSQGAPLNELGVVGTASQDDYSNVPLIPSGTELRTYRLALAADGEYTQFYGGTVAGALAGMVTSMNRVDGVYEREVAVRMVMVANEEDIIYTDPTTDPYTNNDGGTMLGENQANLDAVIGNANYDIGHVFSTGGGGIAGLGVVCRMSSKAEGVTGSSSPVGDNFDIDYVAHEMGHQYGANHTFNGTTSNCGGGNRSGNHAYEPGSGSTIMAYAGICGAEDLQPHSDPYFHTDSFDAIVTYTTVGAGDACAAVTSTGNLPPVVDAGAAYTIPMHTPFKLTGSATDPDNDPLTYDWEEFDLGAAAPPNTDNGNRPIFRSFNPTTGPYRFFPKLSDILANTLTFGEAWPTTNRTMTFRLTARDDRADGGGVDHDSTTVTSVTSAGPFLVTQPNTNVTWTAGGTETVAWDVANTTASPVSCANVDITLSVDGGGSFDTVLAAGTANDGTEQVTVPNISTTAARVMVGCSDNIFLDISDADFTISGGPTPTLTNTPTATNTSIPTDTATATITPGGPTLTPTETFTPRPTATQSCELVNYEVATATATMISGGQDIGNHVDDGSTTITLPFPVTIYGTAYTSGSVSSNGHIEFGSVNDGPDTGCLPIMGDTAYTDSVILLNADLRTDEATTEPSGIFTQTLGTAPNRDLVIRWHTTFFDISGEADFEVIFHESNPQIDVVYGPIVDLGATASTGIQHNLSQFTQYSCSEGTLADGLQVSYMPVSCNTPSPTAVVSPTATPITCTIEFTDVPVGSTFHDNILCLACQGLINGYPCGGPGEPCDPNNNPYFRPGNDVTRGQLSKIVSNAAGFDDDQTVQMFEDVPVGATFFDFIGRLASRGLINGYPCGNPEPCGPTNLPYFRPANTATRGQIAKIDANAAGYNDTPTGQQFEDVLPGSTFYTFTYELVSRGIMSGYPCGGDGEPCGPSNLPYFRPNNNATRGQTSKIVGNTFFPECAIADRLK